MKRMCFLCPFRVVSVLFIVLGFLVLVSCANINSEKATGAKEAVVREKEYGRYVFGKLHVVVDESGTFPVSGIYDLDFIASGVESNKLASEVPQDIEKILKDPTFPSEEQFEQILEIYKEGDLLLYFSKFTRGWALLRKGKIIAVWVTGYSF